jgi:tape measure domain-containing protein
VQSTVQLGGALYQKAGAQIQQYQAVLDSVNTKQKGVAATAGQLSQSFGALKAAVAALGLGLAIKSIANVGNESQKSKIQIEALTAQYGDLGKATESITRIQKVLGISAIDAREGYGQLYAALRATGVSTQQLEVLFVGLTKAARLSGAGAAEAQGALLQLKQAFASGTLSGDELRAVLEAMPAFTAALAKETDALGLTTNATSADIKRLGSEGKLTSDILFSAARKLALANAPGVTSTEQLAAAFKDLQERIAEAFGPAIVQAANTLFGALTGVGNWFKENQGAITAFAKGFLDIAKSVGPIAAGIFIVVKAYQAWQAVSKALAATQAFIMALMGPKGLAMIAAAAVASAAAYKVLGDVSASVTSEVAKQKAEAEKAKNEFNNIANTVDTIPGKAKLATDGFKAMAEETQRAKIAIQDQIASLERGASITAARYACRKSIQRSARATVAAFLRVSHQRSAAV